MSNKLYNIKLAVNDLDKSWMFYKKALSPLGFSAGKKYDDPFDKKPTVVIGNGEIYLELVEDPDLVPNYDISTIKGPRIEFRAHDKEQVDTFYNHLVKNKINILSKPQYMFEDLMKADNDFWYAVYFSDINGIKLGLVHTGL